VVERKSKIEGPKLWGLLGGSFDPVHNGHIQTAKAVQQQLQLDKVLYLPAVRSPFKSASHAANEHRAQMLRLALEGQEGLELDVREFSRPPPSYTVDTLEELNEQFPNKHWVLILGLDAWKSFPTWHQPERILALVNIAVMSRPEYEKEHSNTLGETITSIENFVSHPTGRVMELPVPSFDTSSTLIRNLISDGEDYSEHLAPDVVQYIQDNGLYNNLAITATK
jgi:nicotinate-nucleotide adenylyltransferase